MGRLLILILLALMALAASAGAAQGDPPSPSAAFTFSPLAPGTGQPVHFDGSDSDCLRPPCTYTWTDQPPGGGVWPLGTGETLDFTFRGVGTKYVNLTVRDARGRTDSVEHDVIVSAVPPPDEPPPTPPAPTAAFSYSPQSPATGQEVTFDASISTCSATPCSYAWEDDGPDAIGGTQWPLGSGQKLKFTFSGVGTKYVRLTVTDSLNQKATVEHNVVVSSAPPPPPPPDADGDGVPDSSDQCPNQPGPANNNGCPVPPPPNPQCSDGVDNDHDGLTDYPADPGCSSASDNDETNAPPPPPPGNCDLHATTANFASVFGSANGQTICLASGNYGTWAGGSKSSTVTVQPESGANVTMGLDFAGDDHIRVDGMTVSGAWLRGPTHDVTVSNSTFTDAATIETSSMANANVVFDRDTFANLGQARFEGRVSVFGGNVNNAVDDGVTISNSVFGPGGASDGIQIVGGARGVRIVGNEFKGIKQSNCGAVHCDPVQFYGAVNTVLIDNYFHNNSTGIMTPDGNGDAMTATNNVWVTDGEYPDQIAIGGQSGDVISHNVFAGGARIRIGRSNGGTYSSNETATHNVLEGGFYFSESQPTSTFTLSDNPSSGAYAGGTGRCAYATPGNTAGLTDC
jgi:hypothetical protein